MTVMVILDHFILVGKGGELYVAVGNMHPPGLYIGYLKYVPVNEETPWCNSAWCYSRVLPRYGPAEVRRRVELLSDPCYDTLLPVVRASTIARVLVPWQRLREILVSPRDVLEEDVAAAAGELMPAANIPPTHIGVTGSILAGIHNPRISDIDLVVYGVREAQGVAEALREGAVDGLKPFPREKLLAWVKRLAETYPLEPGIIARLYSPIRRGITRSGHEYSIQYNTGIPRVYGACTRCVTRGVVRIRGDIEPGPWTLNYPSIASLRNIHAINGEAPREATLVSFDALYTATIHRGGTHVVEGLLQECIDGTSRIIVGGVEHPGYIVPRYTE